MDGDHRAKGSREPTPVALTTKPPADVPIACTLGAAAMPGRLADWEALLATATGRAPIDGGVRVSLPGGPAVAAQAAALAAAEQDCCRFFEFSLHIGAEANELDVRAPAEAVEIVHGLFGQPA